MTRPFLRDHRTLPPRSISTDHRAHRAGTEAVERALFPLAARTPGALAHDVGRILRGRTDFPRSMYGAPI